MTLSNLTANQFSKLQSVSLEVAKKSRVAAEQESERQPAAPQL